MATLIAIPLKKTYEVDLTKSLRDIVSSRVSNEEPNELRDNINSLNRMRANSTSKTLDVKHESSLEMLQKYYDQISSLESKVSHLEVSFKWKDAFDRDRSFFLASANLTIPSMAYEKVCILFNIGAVQSQLGVSNVNDGIHNDAALKLAAKYFQSAAGVFQALKHTASSAVGSHELSSDMQNEILNVLQNLMLAQAQETIFYKASNDNMKEVLVSKIANQCEDYYADVLKQMQIVKFNWPEKDWLSIISMKQAAFHGIAEYYQSIVCNQKKEFGEQIARLQKAVDCLKGAETRGGINFLQLFRDHLNRANTALEEAKKDNDFIYHAKVPEYKTLQAIGKAPLVKVSPIPERFFPDLPDLFEKLLPVGVQQAVQKLDLRKQEVVNTEIASLREATQTLNAILSSLNLPAAIEDSTGVEVPKSLRDKANAVKAKGGIALIDRLINELPELLQRNKEILDENERALTSEEQSDESLRAQFKERWTRTASSKLNQNWKEHIAKYRSILHNAVEADNKVKQKLSTHRQKIELLSNVSDSALANAIPSGSGANGLQNSPAVAQLKNLLSQVDAIKNEREVLESEIKDVTFNDMKSKFLNSLVKDGAINELALSTEALGEVYGPIQKQIRESKERQERILVDIKRANDEFVQLKGSSNVSTLRENFLRELAAAHDAYMDLVSNLEEGTKFYNDLTQLLVNLQNKIDDFCFARKAEREELCKDLQNEIVSRPNPPPPTTPAYYSESAPQKPARPPAPATAPQPDMQTQLPFSQQQPQSSVYGANYGQQQQQPYYYPPPPLPTGFNPYAVPQPQNPYQYMPQQQQQHPQQMPAHAPQQPYPMATPYYPTQPNTGYAQYPYPQQQPYN